MVAKKWLNGRGSMSFWSSQPPSPPAFVLWTNIFGLFFEGFHLFFEGFHSLFERRRWIYLQLNQVGYCSNLTITGGCSTGFQITSPSGSQDGDAQPWKCSNILAILMNKPGGLLLQCQRFSCICQNQRKYQQVLRRQCCLYMSDFWRVGSLN